jgi:hypothetical protein
MNSMMGPAVLITLGVLFLLENYHVARGSTFIAVLLIVIGGVKLLQSSASAEGHRQPYPYYAGQVPPAGTTPNPSSQTDNSQVNNNG